MNKLTQYEDDCSNSGYENILETFDLTTSISLTVQDPKHFIILMKLYLNKGQRISK